MAYGITQLTDALKDLNTTLTNLLTCCLASQDADWQPFTPVFIQSVTLTLNSVVYAEYSNTGNVGRVRFYVQFGSGGVANNLLNFSNMPINVDPVATQRIAGFGAAFLGGTIYNVVGIQLGNDDVVFYSNANNQPIGVQPNVAINAPDQMHFEGVFKPVGG